MVTNTRYDLEYASQFKTFFPRMHSSSGDHPRRYEEWIGGVKGRMVPYDRCGQTIKVKVPTFAENLKFFFVYQLHYMYWRYFLWNFSGRQNDVQGHGEVTCGNWITGFDAIDSQMLGDQGDLPPFLAENKGHNKYYLLPLLLGLLGIEWLLSSKQRGKQAFWVTLILFFMTGIAIVLYLNQGPSEPRERDYAYAGSFYAFAIWIGFGVAGLAQILSRLRLNKMVAAAVASLLALAVPTVMACENWDDHDRSDRYVARDFGLNYFNSCAPNAIIFTNGDNDTFPLWYTQETEQNEVSLDKRVCNLSYLQTDWYIDQMRRPAYQSEPLPINWQRKTYVEGKRGVAYLFDLTGGEPLDLKLALDFLASDDPKTKIDPTTGSGYREFLPAKKFRVPVNVDNLIKQGAITEEQRDDVLDEMIIDLSSSRYVTKAELMILNMLANNDWQRPIYYAVTVGSEMYLGLEKYFQLEGLAFRIVPLKSGGEEGTVATDKMYDNMMHKFKFGNVSHPGIYLDENVLRMCSAHRQMFDRLIEALISEGKNEQALAALDYCMEQLPSYNIPHSYTSAAFAEYYYKLGANDKGRQLAMEIGDRSVANLQWIESLDSRKRATVMGDIMRNLAALQRVLYMGTDYDHEVSTKYFAAFENYSKMYRR